MGLSASVCVEHESTVRQSANFSVRQSAIFVSASERQIVCASERHFVSEMCARGAIVTRGESVRQSAIEVTVTCVRDMDPRIRTQTGSHLILPPTISTRTPSAAPSCVVPLAASVVALTVTDCPGLPSPVMPVTASVVALRLCLPLSGFPPREWLLCSRTMHFKPFVNFAGWLAPLADEARTAEVSGIPLPCQPLLLSYGR